MPVQNRAFNKFVEYLGDGTMDLDTDTFKFILLNASHVYDATDSVLADVTANQLGTALGYTAGGFTVTATWTETAGTVAFDSDDPTWTASGGALAATDGIMYDDTPTSPADPLLFDIDFDGEQSAGDGTDFIVSVHASGWFTAAYTDA